MSESAFEGRDLLTAVVDMHEAGRPVKWISRSTGADPRGINWVLKVAGYRSRDVHDLSLYDRAEYLLNDGASHGEIIRTLKTSSQFLNRWFPGSAWETGGWADLGGLVRELKRQEREFYQTGKIQGNRDAGFNKRGDVL